MTRLGAIAIAVCLTAGLAACGSHPQGRVEGGTAAGAGALGSSLTTPEQVNLGDPPWRNPAARPRLD